MKEAEEILMIQANINSPEINVYFDTAIDSMEEYAEQFKPKWIDVKNRFPEEHVKVLTYNGHIGVNWHNGKDWIMFGGVTHWQPLPSCPA